MSWKSKLATSASKGMCWVGDRQTYGRDATRRRVPDPASPDVSRRRLSTVPSYRTQVSERLDHPDHEPGVVSWGDIFTDTTTAAAVQDRLLHESAVFNIDGDSYRFRTHQARNRNRRPKKRK